MKWILPVIVIGALLIGFPASAEFYKYYDADGNVHFTDDYNQVPPEQREAVEGYEESISEEVPSEQPAEEADVEEAVEETEEDGEIASTEEYNIDQKAGEFDQRKAEMEEEYTDLVKEKERLDGMRKNVKTQKQAKQYNEDVKALNERLEEHDQKRQALVTEIEAHNAKLAEEKSNQKKQSKKKVEED